MFNLKIPVERVMNVVISLKKIEIRRNLNVFRNNANVVGAINILSLGIKLLRDEGMDMTHACVAGNCTKIVCGEKSSD